MHGGTKQATSIPGACRFPNETKPLNRRNSRNNIRATFVSAVCGRRAKVAVCATPKTSPVPRRRPVPVPQRAAVHTTAAGDSRDSATRNEPVHAAGCAEAREGAPSGRCRAQSGSDSGTCPHVRATPSSARKGVFRDGPSDRCGILHKFWKRNVN